MFLTLRVTPEFCGEPSVAHPRFFVPQVLEYLGKYGEVLHWAWCYETSNKFGETTHPHFHVNFEADLMDFNKQSFQAWFRRRPMLPKGNKCYAIAVTGDPEDPDRWWRYLMKEMPLTDPIPESFRPHLPPDFDAEIDKHHFAAVDERKLQIKRNIIARDRALQNDSFRLKVYQHVAELCDKDNIMEPTDKFIFSTIIRFYMDNNKVPPFNTAMNMVYDFKCHARLMTPEQYFDLRINIPL